MKMYFLQDYRILSTLIDLAGLIIDKIENIRQMLNSKYLNMYSREKKPAFLIIQKHKEKNVESENCKKDLRAKVYKSLFQNVCIKIFFTKKFISKCLY